MRHANFGTLARMRFDLMFDAATMQHSLQRSVRCDSAWPVQRWLPSGPTASWRVSLGQHSTLLRKLALNNLVRLTDEGMCSVAEVR